MMEFFIGMFPVEWSLAADDRGKPWRACWRFRRRM